MHCDKRLRAIGAAAVVAALLCAMMPVALAGSADACCFDVDARIAEFENLGVRKGNRKLTLTISGWVNEALFMWDDGTDKDAYVGTNFVEQSRYRFLGEAKISKNWSAGYLLEVGVAGRPSSQWDQNSSRSASANPGNREFVSVLRKSNWFVKNEQLGQVAVGLNSLATYHLTDDADATLTRYVDDSEGAAVFLAAFRIRADGQFVNGLRWSEVLRGFNNLTPGQAGRRDVVRYDSPVIAGFSFAASWGENDIADAALTYQGELGDFSVLAKAGYGTSDDPGSMFIGPDGSFVVGGTPCISGSTTLTSLPNFRCNWGGAAATVMHAPSGLFLYGGWGQQSVHTDHVFPAGTALLPTSSMWFLQPGIEVNWLPLGKTAIFAEYRHDDPGSNPGKTVSADVTFWQGGVVQRIDDAAMTLYALYQHTSGTVTGNAATASGGAPVGTTSIDPFQEIIAGAKIDF